MSKFRFTSRPVVHSLANFLTDKCVVTLKNMQNSRIFFYISHSRLTSEKSFGLERFKFNISHPIKNVFSKIDYKVNGNGRFYEPFDKFEQIFQYKYFGKPLNLKK